MVLILGAVGVAGLILVGLIVWAATVGDPGRDD